MLYSKILGTGSFLPEKILTNHELTSFLDTSDEWIFSRSGIKQRHVVGDNDDVVTMATESIKRALDAAQISAKDVDMVIAATCSHKQIFPSLACHLQQTLGFNTVPCFDVQAACSGFMYALNCADSFIKSNAAKNVVVVGSEAMSRVLDWKDRSSCVLFGDGAGAIVLGASQKPGIIDVKLGADGGPKDILYLNNPSSNVVNQDISTPNDGDYCKLMMQGSQVFKFAVRRLGEIALDILESNNVSFDELDLLVPHQANIRIINATAEKIGLDKRKIVLTVDKHANTSAASIPLALDYAIRDGKVKRGNKMLLEAFGGGLTWGAALIDY